MEKPTKPKTAVIKKRKAQVTVSEPKAAKLTPPLKRQRTESETKTPVEKKKSKKKKKSKNKKALIEKPEAKSEVQQKTELYILEQKKVESEASEKYPVLYDKELIDKFLKVPLTNNQKGRIRQTIRMQLQNSDATVFPDIINGKIQAILKGSENLTDSDLKRIRILHNMLKTSLEKTPKDKKEEVKQKKKIEKEGHVGKKEGAEGKVERRAVKKEGGEGEIEGHIEGEKLQKVKGPKRYVVFVGNLPLDINKEKIMNHFAELNEHIKDIRIQKPVEGKKKTFAYVELSNEPSFELALSKHHSMLGNCRINVLYTTQQKSKISKAEAKSKSAKLIALQKSGKLVGSVPLKKKRSHRRMILKQARAKAEALANQT